MAADRSGHWISVLGAGRKIRVADIVQSVSIKAMTIRAETKATGSDYEVVERALRFIEASALEQPSLGELASEVGLSPHHFQRLFTRWAGVSPKRFLAYLTVDRAKRLLDQSWDLLSASHAVGLSGPGRLHDHFVSLDAVTPGEYKSGGAGLSLSHGCHETPFGRAWIAQSPRGIVALSFDTGLGDRGTLEALRRDWPRAELVRDDARAGATLDAIFGPGPGDALRISVRGTNFQVSVWEALLRIPEGQLRSYGQIAAALGRPGAARAVAGAVAANPIAYLIPCHRVIRSLGEIGGYRWGAARKRLILGWEAAHAEQGSATGAAATSRAGTPS
jgi:AraC family transcriptional regulator of adaptative response/methylated-DNA-[protein]-cysteine methyltransferase